MKKLKLFLLGACTSVLCLTPQSVSAQAESAQFSDAVIAYGFLDMMDYAGTFQTRYESECYSTRCDLKEKVDLFTEQGMLMPVGVYFNAYHHALTRAEVIKEELGEDLPLLRQALVKQQYALEKQLRQLYTAEQRQRYAENMRLFLEKYAPLNTVRRFEGNAPDGVDLGWAYLQSERDYFKKLLMALDECPRGCDYQERTVVFKSFYINSPFEYRDFVS